MNKNRGLLKRIYFENDGYSKVGHQLDCFWKSTRMASFPTLPYFTEPVSYSRLICSVPIRVGWSSVWLNRVHSGFKSALKPANRHWRPRNLRRPSRCVPRLAVSTRHGFQPDISTRNVKMKLGVAVFLMLVAAVTRCFRCYPASPPNVTGQSDAIK